MRSIYPTITAFVVIAAKAAAQTNGAAISITEYAVPTTSSGPYGIAGGLDEALWFTEPLSQKIGRITEAGAITEFSGLSASPEVITLGPDGALWFSENNPTTGANLIGHITTEGVLVEIPLPAFYPGVGGIVSGPDGAVWFTATGLNEIGRVTTDGIVSFYPIPSAPNSGPNGITAGPDGALWFAEGTSFSNQWSIDRISTDGVVTENPLPHNSQAFAMATGLDGTLWFTEYDVQKIGRMTTYGMLSEYPLQTTKPAAQFITAGPENSMWFTEKGHVGRITMSGVVTENPTAAGATPQGIAWGDGQLSLWFAEGYGKIANIPACGLGLRLSDAEGTLEASFDLSTIFPGTLTATLTTAAGETPLFSRAVPGVSPAMAFTIPVTTGVPASGTAEMKSTLSYANGGYCQEYETITIGVAAQPRE